MPKRTRHVVFPEAQSPFLNEVLMSLRKCAKGVRYAGGDIAVQRVVERTDGEDIEKLEIQLKSPLGTQAALSIWSDRWIFVHAGHLTKQGWLWEWKKEGRLIGPDKERAVSRNSEKMLEAGLAAGNPGKYCEALWSLSIASGPSVVGPT